MEQPASFSFSGGGPATASLSRERPVMDEPAAAVAPDAYRQLVEQVPDTAIFLLDPDGRVLSWKAGAERVFGWSAVEVVRAHGVVEEIACTGPVLGLLRDEPYPATPVHLASGDTLILATDGLTEARRGGQFLGCDGLARIAGEAVRAHRAPRAVSAAILRGVELFASGPLHDDVCLLVARRNA